MLYSGQVTTVKMETQTEEMQENLEIFNEYMAQNAHDDDSTSPSSQASNSSTSTGTSTSEASSQSNAFKVGDWIKSLPFLELHQYISTYLQSPEENRVYPDMLQHGQPQERYRWRLRCSQYRWHEQSGQLYKKIKDSITKQGQYAPKSCARSI